jgi:hypothetical protein
MSEPTKATTPDIAIAAHPLLDLAWITAQLPGPLGTLVTPTWISQWLTASPAIEPPVAQPGDPTRTDVRSMLRHGGYRPAGRGKPSSEYIAQAASEQRLPVINPIVDLVNAVSLHSGLPLSVVDLDLVQAPLHVDLAAPGSSYIFNASGQEIALGGLLCLHDQAGPCANAVKDAQRSKTNATTQQVLIIIWGIASDRQRTAATTAWIGALLPRLGANTTGSHHA